MFDYRKVHEGRRFIQGQLDFTSGQLDFTSLWNSNKHKKHTCIRVFTFKKKSTVIQKNKHVPLMPPWNHSLPSWTLNGSQDPSWRTWGKHMDDLVMFRTATKNEENKNSRGNNSRFLWKHVNFSSWSWLKRLELFKTLNRKWLTSELFVEGSLNNQNVKGNIRICSLTVWHWTNKSKRARSSKHWWWTLRLIRTSLHLSFNFFLHTISQLVSIHTIQLGHTWCNSDQNYWVVLVLGNAASNSIGKTWCYNK